MSFVLVRKHTLEALPIGADAVFVGCAGWKVDLCLAGDGVDEVHCELVADPHGIRVESLSPDGVLVNGQPVQAALLFANDQLTVGSFEFRVERAGGDSSRPDLRLPVTLHAGASVVFEDADRESGNDGEPILPAARSSGRVVQGVGSSEFRSDGLWRVRLGSLELGPLDWSEIRAMLDRGELQPADSVCRQGEVVWQSIERVTGSQRNSEARPSPAIFSERRRNSSARTGANFSDSFAAASGHAGVRLQIESGETATADSATSATSSSAVVEPQYFIRRRSGEDGPLPRHAVQELFGEGALPANTPVRLEWHSQWSNAVELGFACPDAGTEVRAEPGTSSATLPEPVPAPRGSSADWRLMAPLFYARSALYSVHGLPLRYLVLLLLVLGATAYAMKSWTSQPASTALTGTVLLDDEPLGDVVVTFTGTRSGEVAAGVADSDGRFRILTISGRLSPGPYRITVQPDERSKATSSQVDGRRSVPKRYALPATSDVAIDVTAEQADYQIALSRNADQTSRAARASRAARRQSVPAD